MAVPFLSNIDLKKNEIQNAVIHNQSSEPSNPKAGQVYFNTDPFISKLFVYDGNSWLDTTFVGSLTVGDDVGVTVDVDLATDDLRIIGTGNQTVTTVSKIATDVELQVGLADDVEIASSLSVGSSDGPGLYVNTLDANGTRVYGGFVVRPGNIVAGGNSFATGFGGTTISNVEDAAGLEVWGDTVIIGDLQVTGTTITNNVETVSTSNGVIFEGNVADDNELTLLATDLTADRTIVLPDASGTVALTSDDTLGKVTKKISGNGTATQFVVAHGFGTPIVSVQVLDYGDNGTSATYEVVYTDVQRHSDNDVTIGFVQPPLATQDYLVLISKFPAIS
jgi:hypothetical protein